MTDDEVLKLAEQSGFLWALAITCDYNDELIAFAAAVERATLEQTANVFVNLAEMIGPLTAGDCADILRNLATPDKESGK